MQTIIKRKGRREGAALFTVMLLVLVIGTLLGVMFKASMQRVFMARKLADRVRALAIAEAGANKAYSILQTNFAARLSDNAFPATTYAGGTFDVTVTPVSNNVAVVASLGNFGYATEQVILDVKNFGGDSNAVQNSVALNYSILCGGSLDFAGCGEITSSNGVSLIHANGVLNLKGSADTDLDIRSSTSIRISNNVNLDGSATAPSISYDPSKVTIADGVSIQAVALVPIPDIDLTPYNTWAASNGEVKNGWNFSGGTYNANGGVIWVNGDVNISGQSTINGTIIATGNIKLAGDSTVNAGSSDIALASRDGNIDYQTSGTTYGLIYAKMGNFTQTANGNMEGQLIIKGSIAKGGNSDDLLYARSSLIPPGGYTSNDDLIGVSAWQK